MQARPIPEHEPNILPKFVHETRNHRADRRAHRVAELRSVEGRVHTKAVEGLPRSVPVRVENDGLSRESDFPPVLQRLRRPDGILAERDVSEAEPFKDTRV